ncbi:hypothetical protein V8F33_011205 [Rhypophila sp. PSN 637]
MESPDDYNEDGPNIAFSHCRDQWIQAFNEGPHTSFKMFQKILEVLELGAQDVLHDPTRLLDFRARYVDEHQLYSRYYDTWAGRSGRCTSFAIKVARGLEQMYPGDRFQFEFFDLGKHRVARCQRYGFIIDSESRRGIEMLPEGVNWTTTTDDRRGRWKYYNNHSVFEDRTSSNPRENRDIFPITAAVALGICLEQVARNAVLVCLFRSIPDYPSTSIHDQASTVQYRGAVRWRLAMRRMELTPSLDDRDDYSTITFGDGSPETNRECAINLVAFIKRCGIEHQWKADEIDRFNRQLWQAAILEWGYPVWRS